MTVLRPLEFVNFPSKDAMEAIFCIIFARVFLPTGTALYQMFDVGLSSGVRRKFPGTVSPFGRCATYSVNARYGSRSPLSVFQILLLYFLALFLELSSSPWRFYFGVPYIQRTG